MQAFQKVYNRAEELIIEYNEELKGMEKSDETEERETLRTAEKSERIGKAAPLSAGRQTATKTVS